MPIPQHRFRVSLTARLLLEHEEKTLYLIRTSENGGGFALPGGTVEREEFTKEALIRESFEEVGITLKKKDLILAHVLHKRLKSSIEIIFFFRATVWQGTPVVKELDKFREIMWLQTDDPPYTLSPVVAFALDKIKKGKIYSQFPKSKKTPL